MRGSIATWDFTLDRYLGKLRSVACGGDVPLKKLTGASPSCFAYQKLARQITFCYAQLNPLTSKEDLCLCENRLAAGLLYLYSCCSEADQTIDSLYKMISLDTETFTIMVEGCRNREQLSLMRVGVQSPADPPRVDESIRYFLLCRHLLFDEVKLHFAFRAAISAFVGEASNIEGTTTIKE